MPDYERVVQQSDSYWVVEKYAPKGLPDAPSAENGRRSYQKHDAYTLKAAVKALGLKPGDFTHG